MTRAEEIRLVLAEVAPELAGFVHEPPADRGVIALWAWLTFEQYEIIHRAHCVVIAHREKRGPRICVDCAWAKWRSGWVDEPYGCTHVEVPA